MTDGELRAYLRAKGVDETLLAATPEEELRPLAHAVAVLGGPLHLTPGQAWAQAGAPEPLARELWRAMGFAHLPDDAVALGDADVEALRTIHDHLERSDIPAEMAVRFARLLGQSMSRIADALLTVIDDGAGLLGDEADDDAVALVASEMVNPVIEAELTYLLRRHLYAGSMRRLDGSGGEAMTIGFADVVSFTRLSGQLDEAGLSELLERFESVTADAIAEAGGRVVKLIGDAVLFTFDDPVAAARTAMVLVERFGGDHPDLRVGLAHGRCVSRLGDVFGPPVNLASRLVGYARPGAVLCDEAMAELLVDVDDLAHRALRRRGVKGIGLTPMFVLRRV